MTKPSPGLENICSSEQDPDAADGDAAGIQALIQARDEDAIKWAQQNAVDIEQPLPNNFKPEWINQIIQNHETNQQLMDLIQTDRAK